MLPSQHVSLSVSLTVHLETRDKSIRCGLITQTAARAGMARFHCHPIIAP